MDTTQVPDFKLAKVGKKRERKKGGFYWSGGAGGSSFMGATGGAALAAKAVFIVAIAALGVGAYNVGMQLSPKKAAAKPKAFASKDAPDASAAGSVGPAPASGLAMVSGSLDGKTPEQRAADAAAAEAAAKAEADRKAAEDEAARKAAEEQAKKGAASPVPDVGALAAAAGKAGQNGKGSPFGSKFGALSSNLGGGHSGLAGGAGLSGGVGRSFSATDLGGKSKGMPNAADPGRVAAKRSSLRAGSSKSRAMRQLFAANNSSRGGRMAATTDAAATGAGAAFDNNPGADKAISGGGAGQGGAGAGDHTPEGGGSGSGGGGGGPTGCGGDCSGGAPPPTPTNATPWQDLITGCIALTLVASALLIIAGILSLTSLPWTKLAAEIIGGVVAALGAIILALGIAIQDQGGPGTMYMVTGGIFTAMGLIVAFNPQASQHGETGMMHTITTWGSLFTGLLSGGNQVYSMLSGGDSGASTTASS